MIRRIAIYSRKSRFTGKGDSVENQVQICRDYISANLTEEGVENIIDVYEDEGYSGKSLNRPKFKEMMAKEQETPYHYIVAYKLDRISRNIGNFYKLLETLTEKKTKLEFAKEQYNVNVPQDKAMLGIAAIFAQLERELTAERIKDNMYMMAKDGKWTGGTVPLGYKSVKQTTEDGTHTFYTIEIDEDNANIVKMIFDEFSVQQSLRGVAYSIRMLGFKTRKGKYFDDIAVKRILSNPVYCTADKLSLEYFTQLECNVNIDIEECDGTKGIMPYNRTTSEDRKPTPPSMWVIAVGGHKGLISSTDWITTQQILERNSERYKLFVTKNDDKKEEKHYQSGMRGYSPISLLTGLFYCSCGGRMRPKRYHKGNDAFGYMCCKKEETKKQACNTNNCPGKQIDNTVMELVLNFDVDDNIIKNQLNSIMNLINGYESEADSLLRTLNKEIAEKQNGINNLVAAIQNGSSNTTISILSQQIDKLQEEINNLEKRKSEISDGNTRKKELQEQYNSMVVALNTFRDNIDKLSMKERREFVKKIIDKVVWDGEKADIFLVGAE